MRIGDWCRHFRVSNIQQGPTLMCSSSYNNRRQHQGIRLQLFLQTHGLCKWTLCTETTAMESSAWKKLQRWRYIARIFWRSGWIFELGGRCLLRCRLCQLEVRVWRRTHSCMLFYYVYVIIVVFVIIYTINIVHLSVLEIE